MSDSVVPLARLSPRRDRVIPVDEALASLLPMGGFQPGHVVGCRGVAAMSLAMLAVSRAAVAGAWVAVVGVPGWGVEAAAELGVPLSRLVIVAGGDDAGTWAERVAAAADGFNLVVTAAPRGGERWLRRVRQRMQARGVVLVSVDGDGRSDVGCDLELVAEAARWEGIGIGHGSLRARRVSVAVQGRRMPRPNRGELWLPGHDGQAALIELARQPAPAMPTVQAG